MLTSHVPSHRPPTSWCVLVCLGESIQSIPAGHRSGLLEALSPEETNELRLRTLQPCKLELSGSLEREGKPLAQLKALVELQLPNGPGMLSWLVEKKKPKDGTRVDGGLRGHRVSH